MAYGRLAHVAAATALAIVSLTAAGCGSAKKKPNQELELKRAWIHQQAADHNWFAREALNGTDDVDYLEGWFPAEGELAVGKAWRWMRKRSITRLRTHGDDAPATNMTVTVDGWIDWDGLGPRTAILEFSVNGHVLDTFEPPHEPFAHIIFVPRFLLEGADYVDFVIAATNAATPRGDSRELGMALSGIAWKPAGV